MSQFGQEQFGQQQFGLGVTPAAAPTDTDPPVISNQNPAPGATNVSVSAVISLEITDPGSGLDSTKTDLTVGGQNAVINGVAQPNFPTTITPITDGFRYEIQPVSALAPGTLINIGVYAEDLAGTPNVLNTSYSFTTAIRTVEIDRIFVVSSDVIKVIFTGSVSTGKGYSLATSYPVTPLSGSEEVTVLEVLASEGLSTTFAFLRIRGLLAGNNYRLTLTSGGIFDINGNSLGVSSSTWAQRKTKVDSAVNSLPRMYDIGHHSTVRAILEAMMISDEEIGGS